MKSEKETEMITSGDVRFTEMGREDVLLGWCNIVYPIVQLFNQVA